MYNYGLIGNCQAMALVANDGGIDWLCLPRPDSPPVFGRMLDPNGGTFRISAAAAVTARQHYLANTAVLVTEMVTASGDRFTITDFMPRFEQQGRAYRPLMLLRIVEPLSGLPEIQVSCRPVTGWNRKAAETLRGNSHVRYQGFPGELRLTTDMPLTYLLEERPFTLTGPLHFALTWDIPLEDDLVETARSFLHRTVVHWRDWVKYCSLPLRHQAEVIRSAITLKLHCFEETGAVLAAPTTGLPEIAGGERNWDYRFCWLRDAWFTVSALARLGHAHDLERLLGFLLDVANRGGGERGVLPPVFRLDGTTPLPEIEHPEWAGFAGSQPVRSGNQAAEHVQNDVYGEMLLTLSALYRDERFVHLRDPRWEGLLRLLALRCHETLGQPDAGLWELRGGWKPHAFTAMLSAAGLRAYQRLIASGRIADDADLWATRRHDAERELQRSVADGVLWNAPGELVPDASLALLAILGIGDLELSEGTLATIQDRLSFRIDGQDTGFYFRYRYLDDFGTPKHAFVICSFWICEAQARLGHRDRARQIFDQSLRAANGLGLFAEHFDPATGQQSGNFPQCYSHVGLISAAFACSDGSSLIG